MKSIIHEDLENIYERGLEWEKLKSSTVLITGAYGMLASYVVFLLIYLNEYKGMNIRVVCQGRSPDKMHSRFGAYMDKEYFCASYFSLTTEIDLEHKADYIIHAASLANPSYYKSNPVEVGEANALGTYYLLKYAKACDVKGFLYFSTGDVYGLMPETGADITEETYGVIDPLDEHSCYGESKRMGENWCASFSREYGVPTRIARIGHTYGLTMDVNNDPRVFASFVKDAAAGNNIVMMSDGMARRPFCYIADATAAFFLILFSGRNGEAYNVCNTQQFLSISELAGIIADLAGVKVARKVREENSNYLEASFNKSNKPIESKLKDLGWECQYTAKEGFERCIKYFREEKLGR